MLPSHLVHCGRLLHELVITEEGQKGSFNCCVEYSFFDGGCGVDGGHDVVKDVKVNGSTGLQ